MPDHAMEPLRHIVMIKISTAASPDAVRELASDLDTLVREKPHAMRGSVQRDLGLRPESPRAATWVATLDFATTRDFESYLTSSEHCQFLARHTPEMASLLAVQVPITASAADVKPD
jgi:hypothetical protein